MSILLIIEHDQDHLKSSNFHVVTAAKELGDTIDALIIGHTLKPVVDQAQHLPFIKTIKVADAPDYEHQLAENTAELIALIAKEYDYVIMAASTFGKNILPRVGALLDVAMVGDVTKIISGDTFERPIYAGNAIATVQTEGPIKLLTVRTTAFAAALPTPHQATIETIATIVPNTLSRFERQELTVSTRPELTDARIIVSGGRGLKSAENFKLLEKLADALGAAIGASRAAVDAGFAPNDYQVGQTGKVVAPDLYIAIGISGAIQHVAGMKDSKVIVAINSDPDAPIFQIADYGLVMDLFTAISELLEVLNKR